MKLRILGTGGFANNGIPFNSYIFDDRILVETPPDIMQSLHREGIPFDSIDTIVLTHFHGDHWFGLPFLLFNISKMRGPSPAVPLTIAAPAGLRERIEHLLVLAISAESSYVGWFRRNVRLVEIDASVTLDLGGGAWMRFAPVDHLVPTFGILVGKGAAESRPLFASTSDTRWSPEAAAIVSSGARIVLCDVNGGPGNGVHMGPSEVVSLALPLAAPGTRLVGTHLSTDEHPHYEGLEIARPGDLYEL